MKIVVNGEELDVDAVADITDIIALLGVGEGRVAVMLNGSVITRDDWQQTKLAEADRLEVLQFAGGG